MVQAILDIECNDTDDSRRWIDVSARLATAGTTGELTAASRSPGEADRRGEGAKHTRYPGEQLIAFVESGGCVGAEARQWLPGVSIRCQKI